VPRHLGIRDTCRGADREQSFRVPKNEGRSKGIRYSVAEQPLQQVVKRRVARRMVERVAHCDGHSSIWAQHAHHLAKGRGAIIEEHETELADDSVETPVREREGFGSAFPPFDARALAARDRQHVGVGIDARDGTLRPNALERCAGKNTDAAGDIQYAFAEPDPRRLSDDGGPLLEQRRDKHLVIDFCGCAGSLNDVHVTASNQQDGTERRCGCIAQAIVFWAMLSSHDRSSGSHAAPSVMQPKRPPPLVSIAPDSASSGQPVGKDPLSEVLRTVKLTGALFFLVDATSPWGVEVPHAGVFGPIILPRAQHVISYHIALQGSGFASLRGTSPARFAAGDIIVFPHGDPYSMVSRPGGRAEFDEAASLEFLREMAAGRLPFVVKEGGGGPGRAQFVCGFLGCDARPFNPLLETLPRLLHVKRPVGEQNDLLDRLIDLTLLEAQISRAGGECIRLRLSELIFVEVARRYLATLGVDQTGWLSGLRDPAVGHALSLLHERPAYAWTLKELARQTGVSRSVLADRFMHLVGHPPMQYLTRWRIQLAARLLSDGANKVAAVSQEVGYASEAAFSRTFKRIAGVPPAVWRDQRLTPDL
jgi:AraC-like DNA-binding protein